MAIVRERAPHGTLWRNAADPAAAAAAAWLRGGAWCALLSAPPPAGAVPLSTHNRKNLVFRVEVPGAGPCTCKVSSVPPARGEGARGPGKRLECWFRLFFRRRGLRAMRLALRAAEAGVPTIAPLAFLVSRGPGGVRNVFLYRWAEGVSLRTLWRNEPVQGKRPGVPENPDFLSRLEEAGAIARRLHDAGIVHDDLVPGNFLLPSGGGPLALLDLESARPLCSLPFPAARRRAARRSLHRLTDCAHYDGESLAAFFRGYGRVP